MLKRLVHLMLLLGFVASCMERDGPSVTRGSKAPTSSAKRDTVAPEQVSQYIRCIFQDRDGNLWFGTTTDGVVRYDGRSLDYFNAADQLGSDWVNAIAQDEHGDLWFGTRDGVVHYDGTRFTRYTTKDGLADDRIFCILLDRSGGSWFGTQEGVSRFEGRTFTAFPIPAADLSKFPYYQDPNRINAIVEDKAGNIWFATNGGGAYRYDGSKLIHFSEKEGLCNNFVGSMLVDRKGDLWFGTRFGGLCTYDGTAFAEQDLSGDHLDVLYQQRNGTLWMVVPLQGLCSYDGTSFTRFSERDGPGIRVPMSVLEDARGQLWIGTGAGLYRFEAGRFINYGKEDILRMGAL